MALIGTLIDFEPGVTARSADVDQNFNDIRTAFNNTAVLTDVARVIDMAVTPSSGAARAWTLSPTLTASANDNELTALRIAPTFVPGAFTGVAQRAFHVVSGIAKFGGVVEVDTGTLSTGATATGFVLKGGGNTGVNALQVQDGNGVALATVGPTGDTTITDGTWDLRISPSESQDGGTAGSSTINFWSNNAGTGYRKHAAIQFVLDQGGTGGAHDSSIRFFTTEDDVLKEAARFAENGDFRLRANLSLRDDANTAGGGMGLYKNAIGSGTDMNVTFFTEIGHYWTTGGSGTIRMQLASSGNLGLGPGITTLNDNWRSEVTAMQLRNNAALYGSTLAGGHWTLTNNASYPNTNHYYMSTGPATLLEAYGGVLRFYTAPSGASGTILNSTLQFFANSSGFHLNSSSRVSFDGGGNTEGSENWKGLKYQDASPTSYLEYWARGRGGAWHGQHRWWASYDTGAASVYMQVGTADGHWISGSAWTYNSDARWKQNVEDLGGALDMVRQLRPIWHDWTDEAPSTDRHRQFAYIAQEVQAIPQLSHLVRENLDGYLTLQYERIGAVLAVAAIKEVDDEVATLRNRVAELERKISSIIN